MDTFQNTYKLENVWIGRYVSLCIFFLRKVLKFPENAETTHLAPVFYYKIREGVLNINNSEELFIIEITTNFIKLLHINSSMTRTVL